MNIVDAILTKNDCYKNNLIKADYRYRDFKPKGLMLHSVGCAQPSASVFIKQWNKPGVQKCVHAFIDAYNGNVYQTLPWGYRGWHAGGNGNNTHIGVEMCEPNCIQYTSGAKFLVTDKENAKAMVETTYRTAVELFAYLCKLYGLNPMTDIISHSEGYKRGIASGHSDPDHLWKGCEVPYTMDTFRYDVADMMNGKAPEQKEVWYTVEKGDTLSKIAKKYDDIKWQEIAQQNGIKFPYIIKVGQKLRIK